MKDLCGIYFSMQAALFPMPKEEKIENSEIHEDLYKVKLIKADRMRFSLNIDGEPIQPFILEDGSENKKTCPVINTEIFLKHGLEQKDKQQILEGNIMILPSICMCPIDFETGYRRKSKKRIRKRA